jgi:hypothetical protein
MCMICSHSVSHCRCACVQAEGEAFFSAFLKKKRARPRARLLFLFFQNASPLALPRVRQAEGEAFFSEKVLFIECLALGLAHLFFFL